MQERVTKGLILILMGLIVLLHLSLEEAKRPEADSTDRKEQELQSRQKPNIVRMKIEEIRTRVTLREIQEKAEKKVRISKEKPKRSPIRAPKPRKRNKKKPILTAKVSVSDNLIKQGLSVIGQKGEMIGQFQKVAARPGVDASRICYLAGVLLHCQPHHLVPSSNTWTRSAFQGLEAPCTELAMVAEKMLRKAVETIRLERGEDHPTWLFGMSLLATALFRQGRLEETEAQHVRLLRLQRQLAGEEDPQTMKAMVNLGIIFLYRKKLARAEAVLRRALELQEAHLGPDYPERHKAMYNLALVLKLQNRLEEAEPMHRRALDLQRRHLGDNHPETRQSLAHFLGLLHLLGRSEEHRRLTEAELERLRQAVERPGASARNHSDFARMLLTCNIEDLRDVDAAVASARRAVELSGGRVIPYLAVLVLACHQAGDLFETIRWQKRLVTLAAPAQPSKFTVVERSLVELLGKTRGAFGLLEATCHILAARLVKRVLAKRAKG